MTRCETLRSVANRVVFEDTPMTIFRIEPDVDNYCSLRLADAVLAESKLMAFDGTSREAQWHQPMAAVVDNAEAPVPEILDIGAGNLVLFGRSSKLLRDELAFYCELLPVLWAENEGEVVNVLGLSDCLDPDSSKWVIGAQSGKRIRIEQYEFVEQKVPERLVFKIPERRFETFCTDEFADLLKAYDLRGINLVPVWTSSPDSPPSTPRG